MSTEATPGKKRVYIAYTGGTIGMMRTPSGYRPEPGRLADFLTGLPELRDESLPEIELHEYSPLLDSADMLPRDWLRIASDIANRYDDFDGFVVLHGTDTMAYTASALPFLFRGLAKPVILTGSQIPLAEVRSDARDNLITSLLLASRDIPEVCVYFGNRLFRGCRAVKVSATGFDAFDSPNMPPLAEAGVDIEVYEPLLRAAEDGPFELPLGPDPGPAPVAATLRLFPGISGTMVRNMLRPPLQGLVLEAYGVGNGPVANPDFIAALREAVDRGVVVVDCTQCLYGGVHIGDYATGRVLSEAGVISGADMTTEAALAKLLVLLWSGLPAGEVGKLMGRDLRGELSET